MNTETTALVQRWIIAFCETPILIDADLMRHVLGEHEARMMDAARAASVTRLAD